MVPSKFKGDLILLSVNDASRPGFCSLLTLVNVCFYIFIACWVIFHAFAVFKINFLNIFFSRIPSECLTVWIQIMLDIL